MEYDFIKKIVNQQFEETPEYVISVGWGTKYTNGKSTEESCLRYEVLEKKPLDLLDESEIIPPTIVISGVTFKTDIIQSRIKPTQQYSNFCDPTTYSFWYQTPITRLYTRPLTNGLSSINYTKSNGYTCTMGFIAMDNDTGSLVGVSNNHCYVSDAFFCSLRNPLGFRENEENSIVIQPAEGAYTPTYNIGVVKKYVPLTGSSTPTPIFNRVDGACTTLNQGDIDFSSSFRFTGLYGTYDPLKFATTAELNSLVGLNTFSTSPNLYSTGRTTGPKGEGACKLKIDAFPVTIAVPYNRQNVDVAAYFEEQIAFRLVCPAYTATTYYCRYPINGGDSGSALLADVNGERKIIGLAFACSIEPGTNDCYRGYANRIDHVASELNISAWTGQSANFSNISLLDSICLPNQTQKSIVINGKTYWQLGFCGP